MFIDGVLKFLMFGLICSGKLKFIILRGGGVPVQFLGPGALETELLGARNNFGG